MTERQELIKKKQEARQLMRYHEPNKNAMGNMYWYWKDVWEKAEKRLQEIRLENVAKRASKK